jgi:hypothetical protein
MANSKSRCLHCREYHPSDSVLRLPAGSFCSLQHAVDYGRAKAQKAREKAQKAKEKAQAAEHKAQKVEFEANDIQHQHKLTQSTVNRLCLLLDQGKPCISCGRPDQGGRMRNASHFKSRGANSFLRYDLRGLHASCVPCNLYQSGNIEGYRQGLLERYGSAIVEYLDTAPRVKAWTAPELIQMRSEVSEEIRRLERGESPSRNWRQLLQTNT